MKRKKLIEELTILANNCNNIQVKSILYSTVLSMEMNKEKNLADNIQLFTKKEIFPLTEKSHLRIV